MTRKQAQEDFAVERDMMGLWDWLPEYKFDKKLGQIITINRIDIVVGFPPNDRFILNSNLDKKHQKWRRNFCGGTELFRHPEYVERVNLMNRAILIAYENHSQNVLWNDLIQLGEREYDRLVHGIWVYINGVATFFPPNYYFYLTYCCTKEGGEIEYIDADRESFLFTWWLLTCGIKGEFKLKRRQCGKSLELGANELWLAMIVKNQNFGLQSMSGDKVKTLYKECVLNQYNGLPLLVRRMYKGTGISDSIFFGSPGVAREKNINPLILNGNYQTESSLITRYPLGKIECFASAALGGDGETLAMLICDEVGKMKDVDVMDRHLVNVPATKFILCATTIELMSMNQIQQVRDFYEFSSTRGENLSDDGETPTKIVNFFMSSVRGYIDSTTRGTKNEIRFVDEYGNSRMEDCYRYIVSKRQSEERMGADRYLASVRKIPINTDEPFLLDTSSSALNATLLMARKTQLERAYTRQLPYVVDGEDENGVEIKSPIAKRYNLVWENGVRFGKVVAVPDREGDFYIVSMPVVANNIKTERKHWNNPVTKIREVYNHYTPLNSQGSGYLYGAGIDPYAFNHAGVDGSKGGITVVFNDRSGYMGYRPVLYFCKRENDTDGFYEKALMACWFYGCTGVWDKKSEDFTRYFNNVGCIDFVETKKMTNPDKAISAEAAMQRGENTANNSTVVEYTRILSVYVDGYSKRINILPLINQLTRWRLGKDKTTNILDGAFSFALALFNCQVPAYIETTTVKNDENYWGYNQD